MTKLASLQGSDEHHQHHDSAERVLWMTSKQREALARDGMLDGKYVRKEEQKEGKGIRGSSQKEIEKKLVKSPAMADIPGFLTSIAKKQSSFASPSSETQSSGLPDHGKKTKNRKLSRPIRGETQSTADGERGLYFRRGADEAIHDNDTNPNIKAPRTVRMNGPLEPDSHHSSLKGTDIQAGPNNTEKKALPIHAGPPAAVTHDSINGKNNGMQSFSTEVRISHQIHDEANNQLAIPPKEDSNKVKLRIARCNMLAYLRLKGFVTKIDDLIKVFEICDSECHDNLETWTKLAFNHWQHVEWQITLFIRCTIMLDYCQVQRPLGTVERIAHALRALARQERPLRQKVQQVMLNNDPHALQRDDTPVHEANGAHHEADIKSDDAGSEEGKRERKKATMRELRDMVRAQSFPAWKDIFDEWEGQVKKDVEQMQKVLRKHLRLVAEQRMRGRDNDEESTVKPQTITSKEDSR